MQRCPKCERKTRVYYKRRLIKGKHYWITVCIKCRTPLDLEPFEKEGKRKKRK